MSPEEEKPKRRRRLPADDSQGGEETTSQGTGVRVGICASRPLQEGARRPHGCPGTQTAFLTASGRLTKKKLSWPGSTSQDGLSRWNRPFPAALRVEMVG